MMAGQGLEGSVQQAIVKEIGHQETVALGFAASRTAAFAAALAGMLSR